MTNLTNKQTNLKKAIIILENMQMTSYFISLFQKNKKFVPRLNCMKLHQKLSSLQIQAQSLTLYQLLVEKDTLKFIMQQLGDPTVFQMNLKKILRILDFIMKKWEEQTKIEYIDEVAKKMIEYSPEICYRLCNINRNRGQRYIKYFKQIKEILLTMIKAQIIFPDLTLLFQPQKRQPSIIADFEQYQQLSRLLFLIFKTEIQQNTYRLTFSQVFPYSKILNHAFFILRADDFQSHVTPFIKIALNFIRNTSIHQQAMHREVQKILISLCKLVIKFVHFNLKELSNNGLGDGMLAIFIIDSLWAPFLLQFERQTEKLDKYMIQQASLQQIPNMKRPPESMMESASIRNDNDDTFNPVLLTYLILTITQLSHFIYRQGNMLNFSEDPPLADLNLIFTTIYQNFCKKNSVVPSSMNPLEPSFTKMVQFTTKRLQELLEYQQR